MDAFDLTNSSTPEEQAFLKSLATPVALKRRSLRIGALLEGSSVKALDIMQAEFGTLRPVGLNLGQIPNPDISLGVIGGPKDPFKDSRSRNRSQWASGEYIHGSGIFISPESLPVRNPATNDITNHRTSTLGHEWMHSLQYQAYEKNGDYLLKMRRFIGPVLNLGEPETLKEKTENLASRFNRFASEVSVAHRKDGKTGALKHVFGMQRSTIGDYYATDMEFQARLHSCMAAGYASWGRMPTTKTELQAALYNCGAKVSGSTLFTLYATEEGRKARADFPANDYLKNEVYTEIHDINEVFKYASTTRAEENLWHYGIPGLYGHMLELYGDESGRERMGLGAPGHDIRNVMQHIVKAENEQIDEPGLRAVARTISVENAAELASNIIYHMQVSGKNEAGNIVLDEMLKHDELKRALIAPASYSTYGRMSGLTPFESAVYFNKRDTMKLFLDAGADPFTVVQRTDPLRDTCFTTSVFHLGYIDTCKKEPQKHAPIIEGMKYLNEHYAGDRNTRHRVWGNFDGSAQQTKMLSFNEVMESVGIIPRLENPQNSARKPSPGMSV